MKNSGYLVILTVNEYVKTSEQNKYKGVDNFPSHYDDPPEELLPEKEAMDLYVWTDRFVEDDEAFMLDLETAKTYLDMLNISHRKFEIIYVIITETGEEKPPDVEAEFEFRGYDVAWITGDKWSILFDFPEELSQYKKHLNKNILFDSINIAKEYRAKYIEMKLPDWDVWEFEIGKIYGVKC